MSERVRGQAQEFFLNSGPVPELAWVMSLRRPGTAEQDHGLGMGRVGKTVKEGHGVQSEASIQERLEISCQAGVITGHPDERRR